MINDDNDDDAERLMPLLSGHLRAPTKYRGQPSPTLCTKEAIAVEEVSAAPVDVTLNGASDAEPESDRIVDERVDHATANTLIMLRQRICDDKTGREE